MNTLRNTLTACGLVALAALAATPAGAQAPGFVRHHQMHHAARLDRMARHAASNGNYHRARSLRFRAANQRYSARHGY